MPSMNALENEYSTARIDTRDTIGRHLETLMLKMASSLLIATLAALTATLAVPSVALAALPDLELRVNRVSGLTTIAAVDGDLPLGLTAYTIQSNPANLPLENIWVPANWNSLSDQYGGTWEEVVPAAPLTQQQVLSELNLTGATSISPSGAIPLGNIYNTADSAEDISFTYGIAGSTVPLTGNVVFEGLVLFPSLELHVNRWDGHARIMAVGHGAEFTDPANAILPVEMTSYTIRSDPANPPLENVWLPANWNSFSDQYGGGWEEVPPVSPMTQQQALSELNLETSKSLELGDAVSLGLIYDTSDNEEDVSFSYGLAGDPLPLTGIVVFEGDGIHVRVNKSSGRIELVNGETVGIDFDGYVIQSPSNKLTTTGWTSLEDQAVPGWQETASNSAALSELNLLSSSLLPASGTFDLGQVYQGGVGGVEDLTFDFNLTGLGDLNSVVEYFVPGDMDGDGDVDADDTPLFVQALVSRSAYQAHGFTNSSGFLVDPDVVGDVNEDGTFDTGDISAFNALLSGAGADVSVPVPEPASATLFGTACSALALAAGWRRRPKQCRA